MWCCFPKCHNKNGKGKKCYMARFPSDPLRFQEWLDNILKNHDSLPFDWDPTSNSHVCEVIIFKKLSKTYQLIRRHGYRNLVIFSKYHKLTPSFHTYASCLAIYITLYFIIVFWEFWEIYNFWNDKKFFKIQNRSAWKTKKKKTFTLRIILTLICGSNPASMELCVVMLHGSNKLIQSIENPVTDRMRLRKVFSQKSLLIL